MLFNSLQFLIFFPTVTAFYFLLPHKYRWFMLLVASCIFYIAFIPVYIFVLFATIVIDYIAAIFIEREEGEKKKIYLIISIISTCFVLFIFKYFNFINGNISAIARFLHWNYPVQALQIILPIGLSFHTFQSLSYVIEVYWGKQKAEHHFGIYALYVMFYPQLVAGPIERPQHLLHQFYEKHTFDYNRVTDGLKLMAWGMFKKVVIADRLALFVTTVYGKPYDYQGVSLILATVFFAFQIYCDFSGYTDIAIGAAQIMGFKLMDNFNRPYSVRSIQEFWRKWNISLSTWFRDYVYIPLGGNRIPQLRWCFNIFFTFLLSGLWHGANCTFIAWGAFHGFYYLFSFWTKKARTNLVRIVHLDKFPRMHNCLQIGITFVLVCFAWIFFRANNIQESFYILSHLFSGIPVFVTKVFSNITALNTGKHIMDEVFLGIDKAEFFIAVAGIIFLEYIHLIQKHGSIRHMLNNKPLWLRWGIYYCFVIGLLSLGVFENRQFIYFQF